MAGKLIRKARRTLLPVTGQKVTEITFGRSCAFRLVFGEGYDAELAVEEAVSLRRGSHERVLAGSRPGEGFDVAGLGPVLEVFGLEVGEAAASDDGSLRLAFRGGPELCVTPSRGYEAWHFRSPGLSLHGADGRLSCFG